MAVYAQSTLTLSDAKTIVQTSAGNVTDTDLGTLAARSLQQAIERWNNHHLWNWLLVEAGTIGVSSTLGGDYPLPGDFGFVYDVKLTTLPKVLRPMTQREYDWYDPLASASTPGWYGTFNSGTAGTLRIYPTPSLTDLLLLRYYRRMAIPMESVAVATCSTQAADYTDASCTTVSGSDVLTLGTAITTTTIQPGCVVAGTGVTAGTTVLRILTSTTVQMSAAATSPGAGRSMNFGLNILTTTVTNGFNNVRTGAPVSGTGIGSGKTVAKLLSTTTLLLSSATAAATGSITATFDSGSVLLDIPADFERAILALGKYYYLTDKGGDSQRIQNWKEEAERGLMEAKNKDAVQPDEMLAFQPGYLAPSPQWPMNPNAIGWAGTDW